MQLEGEAYQGSWGRDGAAQLFLDAGCSDSALDNNSCSALHYAAGAPALPGMRVADRPSAGAAAGFLPFCTVWLELESGEGRCCGCGW